jgi:hypothetical protein
VKYSANKVKALGNVMTSCYISLLVVHITCSGCHGFYDCNVKLMPQMVDRLILPLTERGLRFGTDET